MPHLPLNIRSRWWFLSDQGWNTFRDDPVAQGYEILSRAPVSADSRNRFKLPVFSVKYEVTGLDLRRSATVVRPYVSLECGKQGPRPTWATLSDFVRRAFLLDYKFDLRRMGLANVTWPSRNVMTFDCTLDSRRVQAIVRHWVGSVGLLQERGSTEERDRTRARPEWLKFSVSKQNKDMVTLDWRKLIDAYTKESENEWTQRFADDVAAAARTFLESPEFVNYRRLRLAAHSNVQRKNKPYPVLVAMMCVNEDCMGVGLPFKDQITDEDLSVIGLGRKGLGTAKEHRRRFDQICGLKKRKPSRVAHRK